MRCTREVFKVPLDVSYAKVQVTICNNTWYDVWYEEVYQVVMKSDFVEVVLYEFSSEKECDLMLEKLNRGERLDVN